MKLFLLSTIQTVFIQRILMNLFNKTLEVSYNSYMKKISNKLKLKKYS